MIIHELGGKKLGLSGILDTVLGFSELLATYDLWVLSVIGVSFETVSAIHDPGVTSIVSRKYTRPLRWRKVLTQWRKNSPLA